MSDNVSLTETEREALARTHYPSTGLLPMAHGGTVQRDIERAVEKIIADRERAVRAAVLAPIRALVSGWRAKAEREGRSIYDVLLGLTPGPLVQIEAALAAPDVDAAPGETTTEKACNCDCTSMDGTLSAHMQFCRAAVLSGHEQEGDA